VGRVEAIEIEGLEMWFNSSDHLPEHLHVRRRGEWEIRVYFLLCTDDELVFDLLTPEEAEVREVVTRAMREAMSLAVPIEVSVGTGPNWLEAH